MYLSFNNHQFNFQIIEQDTNLVSMHTGKPIQQLKIQTTLRGETENNNFLEIIKSADITSQNNDGNLTYWKLGDHSYSYTDRSSIYRHILEIKEIESFQISSLEIGDVIVQPYCYEESFKGDELTIDAKVILTEEQHILWKTMLKNRNTNDNNGIIVIRHGINDQPRQMELIIGNWSKDGNQIKHECRLVDFKENSQLDPIMAAFRWIGAMSYQVAQNQALVEGLITSLVNKGVISDDEANQIRSEAIDQTWENRYNFFKVDNLDTL